MRSTSASLACGWGLAGETELLRPEGAAVQPAGCGTFTEIYPANSLSMLDQGADNPRLPPSITAMSWRQRRPRDPPTHQAYVEILADAEHEYSAMSSEGLDSSVFHRFAMLGVIKQTSSYYKTRSLSTAFVQPI